MMRFLCVLASAMLVLPLAGCAKKKDQAANQTANNDQTANDMNATPAGDPAMGGGGGHGGGGGEADPMMGDGGHGDPAVGAGGHGDPVMEDMPGAEFADAGGHGDPAVDMPEAEFADAGQGEGGGSKNRRFFNQGNSKAGGHGEGGGHGEPTKALPGDPEGESHADAGGGAGHGEGGGHGEPTKALPGDPEGESHADAGGGAGHGDAGAGKPVNNGPAGGHGEGPMAAEGGIPAAPEGDIPMPAEGGPGFGPEGGGTQQTMPKPTDVPGVKEGTPEYLAVDFCIKVVHGKTGDFKTMVSDTASGLLKKLRENPSAETMKEATDLMGHLKPINSRRVERDTVVYFQNDNDKILQFYVRQVRQGEYEIRELRVRDAVKRPFNNNRRRR